MALAGVDPGLAAFLAYVLAFGAAGVVCFASIPRANRIADDDTRRGLVWLLVLCGGWSAAHVGFIVAPWQDLQLLFYVIGLSIGFAATGAWLYFCSAYTGRTLHRNPLFRKLAVAVYVGVIAVKVTNGFHGLYFSTSSTTEPFAHLAVQHGLLHWVAMGLAYALATVGYFMLVERFLAVGQDTRPLIVLVGLTGLPLVLDVVGQMNTGLLDMTYEPLGVAAFAVGVLYLYIEEFQAVQLAGTDDKPLVFLDDQGRIREYNRPAHELFPDLEDAIGQDPGLAVPIVQELLEQEGAIVNVQRGDEQRYYRVSRTPITAGDTELGVLLGLEDVTAAEQSRRELQRERERLDRFASVVAHDLRNPLNVADGRLDLALQAIGDGETADATRTDGDGVDEAAIREHLEAAAGAQDRMAALIEDLLVLAREGRDIDELATVALEDVAEGCWANVDADAATLTTTDAPTIEADPERIRQLLENLFRNAIEHGGADVTITLGGLEGGDGFYVEDDGPGIPAEDREDVFEAGFTTNPEGTGFGLPIVKEIADAHGWSIAVSEAGGGGARFEISGVALAE